MAEVPEVFDRMQHWTTLKRGIPVASIGQWLLVSRNTGSLDLEQWAYQGALFSRTWLSSILGTGEYEVTSSLYLWRGGNVIDTAVSVPLPLSILADSYPFPANVTALSSYRPDPQKPRVVSRTYWPFIRTSLCDSDTTLSLAGQAAVDFVASKYLGVEDWGGSGFAIRAIRYIRHKSTGLDERLVTVSTSRKLATQRRRLLEIQRSVWNR